MAGNNSIQLLRGSLTYDPATSTEVLLDGQPFYSKYNKLLYVGVSNTELLHTQPVGAANIRPSADIDGNLLKSSEGADGEALSNYSLAYGRENTIHIDIGNGDVSGMMLRQNYFDNLKHLRLFWEANNQFSTAQSFLPKDDDTSLTMKARTFGSYSAAFGISNTVSSGTFAAGRYNWVAGTYSASFGNMNVVQGENSLVIGLNNLYGKTDKNDWTTYSIISGGDNRVFGSGHLVGGMLNTVGKVGKINPDTGEEWDKRINPTMNIVWGNNLISNYDHQYIFGQYNLNKAENVVEIGYGTGDSSYRKNIFEITRDGLVKANNLVLINNNSPSNILTPKFYVDLGLNKKVNLDSPTELVILSSLRIVRGTGSNQEGQILVSDNGEPNKYSYMNRYALGHVVNNKSLNIYNDETTYLIYVGKDQWGTRGATLYFPDTTCNLWLPAQNGNLATVDDFCPANGMARYNAFFNRIKQFYDPIDDIDTIRKKDFYILGNRYFLTNNFTFLHEGSVKFYKYTFGEYPGAPLFTIKGIYTVSPYLSFSATTGELTIRNSESPTAPSSTFRGTITDYSTHETSITTSIRELMIPIYISDDMNYIKFPKAEGSLSSRLILRDDTVKNMLKIRYDSTETNPSTNEYTFLVYSIEIICEERFSSFSPTLIQLLNSENVFASDDAFPLQLSVNLNTNLINNFYVFDDININSSSTYYPIIFNNT